MPDTANISNSSTVTPLSRTEFDPTLPASPVPAGIASTSPKNNMLSDSEHYIMQRALHTLKAAREGMKSPDPKVSGPARNKLLLIVSYMLGFFDAKGAVRPARQHFGFEVITGLLPEPSLESALDDLVAEFEKLVNTPQTRLTPVGAAIGAVLIAVGEYLLAE